MSSKRRAGSRPAAGTQKEKGEEMFTSELYKKVAESTGMSEAKVKAVAEGLVHEFLDCAKEGEPVRFGSFGTFKVRHVPEHLQNDPRNKGEKVTVKAHDKIVFQESATTKAYLNTI